MLKIGNDEKFLKEYSEIYKPLIGTKEFVWFESYAEVLSANPRTLKRTLNIYSVFRCVRKYLDPSADTHDNFAKKLLKSVRISEQLSFAFAWILQVILRYRKIICC